MNVTTRATSSALILDIQGRLTVEEDLGKLTELVQGLVRVGATNVLLNLEGIWQIDCAGIGQLARCYRETRIAGGSLKLVNMRFRPRRLLEMARLLTTIEAFDSEEQALSSFEKVGRLLSSREDLGRDLRARALL